ncbi:BTB/POZ domain-containing protein [Histoplasma capsulatum G186AR]|uniref:BTB/POZ domain-containing protein n=1 Tax=Ajellomyces capsulatus (strain G186AR / H82 / ATCC MYA-2454 / RMSCC 2432) TaxID=447093 RepID=C0NR88_AJECG|nr:BTB/POZ domain-containing protein [Histoplasma capsulatum G186AR]EEH06202.1 BTB/POZ domain-containing protein [Histoplasma capsulatum G186AR]
MAVTLSSKTDITSLNDTTYTLSASLKRLFHSSKFTDITIQAGEEEFKVHKLILSGQSEYFSRMFSAEWKLEDDPRTIEAMLRFMYGLDYDSSSQGRTSPMLFASKVYVAADYYGIPELKEKAKAKFKVAVRACWNMNDFPIAIVEVYTRTLPMDRNLHNILANTAKDHFELLLQKDEFLCTLEQCGRFAADIAKLLASNYSSINVTKYKCPKSTLHRNPTPIILVVGNLSPLKFHGNPLQLSPK